MKYDVKVLGYEHTELLLTGLSGVHVSHISFFICI